MTAQRLMITQNCHTRGSSVIIQFMKIKENSKNLFVVLDCNTVVFYSFSSLSGLV